jgi:hypothetical protein
LTSNRTPRRIKPEAGKIVEDPVESSTPDDVDVFDCDCIRFRQFDDIGHDRPQAAPIPGQAKLRAHRRDVLARESASNDIEARPRLVAREAPGLRERVTGIGDVVQLLDVRPVTSKHRAAVRIPLDEARRLGADPALQREVEATDA